MSCLVALATICGINWLIDVHLALHRRNHKLVACFQDDPWFTPEFVLDLNLTNEKTQVTHKLTGITWSKLNALPNKPPILSCICVQSHNEILRHDTKVKVLSRPSPLMLIGPIFSL